MLYLVGSGFKCTDIDKSYPYQVLLDTDTVASVIGLTEGKGMGSVGGSFSAKQLLKPHFIEHLGICKTEWLIPIIEDAASSGSEIDPQTVLESFEYKFGNKPPLAKKY